jgi:hypothetical protein
MSMKPSDFANEINLLWLKSVWKATRKAEYTAVSTALGTDTTKHDKTIEVRPAGLKVDATNTYLTNALNLIVNKGIGGGVTQAQMVTALAPFIA